MRKIRSYRDVADPGNEDIVAQVVEQAQRVQDALAQVRQVVVIASGKGGVGKSAITAALASALANRDLKIGALDADLNGPSLGRMLGVSGQLPRLQNGRVDPVRGTAGVRVVSMDLLLAADGALRWASANGSATGPAFLFQSMYEGSALREFIADVEWGRLDCLLIDAPPGTDKLDRILQLLPTPPVLLLITTPSQVTRHVVARSVAAARDLPSARTAVVLNMAGLVCQHCGKVTPLFDDVSAEDIARAYELDVWASIPFDPAFTRAIDRGQPFEAGSPAAAAIDQLAVRIAADL